MVRARYSTYSSNPSTPKEDFGRRLRTCRSRSRYSRRVRTTC
ncbi:hypothetical protein [Vulcanisaeta sp. JCM 16159]